MSVKRILVTGNEEQLQTFHLAVGFVANAIERREQTIFYTVFDYDFDTVYEIALDIGLEIEELKQENFFDAVRHDPEMTDEQKKMWLEYEKDE